MCTLHTSVPVCMSSGTRIWNLNWFTMSSFESSLLKAYFADLRWRMMYQRCTLNWPSTITEQDYSGLDLKLLPCNIQDQLVWPFELVKFNRDAHMQKSIREANDFVCFTQEVVRRLSWNWNKHKATTQEMQVLFMYLKMTQSGNTQRKLANSFRKGMFLLLLTWLDSRNSIEQVACRIYCSTTNYKT